VLSEYAILKVPHEGEPQLAASFLQADEGIATTAAQVAPCSAADFSPLGELPNVALRTVVVRRDCRMVEDQQQFLSLFVNPLQDSIQFDESGAAGEQFVEAAFQAALFLFRGSLTIGHQTPVVFPKVVADAFQRLFLPRVEGKQLAKRTLGMDPAQPVQKAGDVELARVIAHQRLMQVQLVVKQGAHQGPLRHHLLELLVLDSPLAQLPFPRLVPSDDPRPLSRGGRQLGQPFLRQPLPLQVGQSVFVHDVLVERGTQNPQEVDAVLAVRRGERCKQRIADDVGITVLPLMPSPRVVGLKVLRHLSRRGQQSILLLVERLVAFCQDRVDLSHRDVDPQFQQLLVDQGLGDMILMVLIEDVSLQLGREMPLDMRRQRCDATTAVREKVTNSLITHVVGLMPQTLNDEILVPISPRALGKPFQRQRNRFMNRQLGRLAPFGRPRSLLAAFLLARRTRPPLLQHAGPNDRATRQSLQPGNLLTLLPVLLRQLPNHPYQLLNQRRPFCRGNLDPEDLDRFSSIHHPIRNTKTGLRVKTNVPGLLRSHVLGVLRRVRQIVAALCILHGDRPVGLEVVGAQIQIGTGGEEDVSVLEDVAERDLLGVGKGSAVRPGAGVVLGKEDLAFEVAEGLVPTLAVDIRPGRLGAIPEVRRRGKVCQRLPLFAAGRAKQRSK